MARLELQLDTKKARENIKLFRGELRTLERQLSAFRAATAGFDKLANSTQRLKGINRAAIRSFSDLSREISRLSRSADSVSRVSRKLNRLSALNVGRATGQVRALSASMIALGGSFRGVSGLVAGFGVTLGAVGLARFLKSTFDVNAALIKTETTLKAVTGSTEAAASEMSFLRNLSNETATDLLTLSRNHVQLAAAAQASGEGMEFSRKITKGLSIALRVMGTNSFQADRAFRAITQSVGKGRVQMEELRQQLGEQLPTAIGDMARALNVTTSELFVMIRAGQVGNTELGKFADFLIAKYGASLPDAIRTPTAALEQLGNAFIGIQEAFGEGFLAGTVSAFNSLDDAFRSDGALQAARDLGTLAGVVANVLGIALSLAARNADLLERALFAMAAIKIAGFIAGAATSLVTLATSARAAGIGMTSASVAARGFLVALGPIAIAFGVVGILLPEIIGLFRDWSNSSEAASQSSSNLADAANRQAQAANAAAGEQEAIAQATDMTAKAARSSSSSIASMVGELFGLSGAASDASGSQVRLAASGKAMATAERSAAKEADNVASATSSASGAVDKLGSEFTSAAKAADRAAAAFRRAAAEAKKFKKISGGPGELPTGAGRKGGLAGRLPETQLVSPSAFRNAPHFQGGTANTNAVAASVPGGGIPSILHPNEAVVPLPGGRSIPVSFRGLSNAGGGGSPLMAELLKVNRQIKREIAIGREATNTQTKILREESNQVEFLLTITNTTLFNIQKRLDNAAFASAQRGSGGDFGGTGISGGGPTRDRDFAQKQVDQLKEQARSLGIASGAGRVLGGTDFGTPQGTITNKILRLERGSGGGLIINFFREFSQAQLDSQNAFLDAQIGFAQDFGSEQDVLKALQSKLTFEKQLAEHKTKIENAPAFSGQTGSPNLSKDPSGGFRAIIHPDEAIIPLTDGRTVPVDLSNTGIEESFERVEDRLTNVQERMNALDASDFGGKVPPPVGQSPGVEKGLSTSETSNGSSNSGKGDLNITVNMTVNAADAESFHKSEGQIIQDLTTKINRVKRTLGQVPFDEDPTRRPGE